jgi:hypothetical protein
MDVTKHRNRVRLLLASLLAAGLLAAVVWRYPSPPTARGTPEASPSGRGDGARVEIEPAGPARTSADSRPAPSSPAAAGPVLPSLAEDDGAAGAARNDAARAACELAALARHCQMVRNMLEHQPDETREIDRLSAGHLEQAEVERQVGLIAERQRLLEDAQSRCTSVDATPQVVLRHTLAAAGLGDPVAQVLYLQGHHLNGAWLLRDPTLLDHYRRHANRYFMQALEAGEPTLIALWHMAAQAGENAALSEFLPEAWRTRGFVAALTDQLSEAQRDGIFFPGMLDRRRVEPTPEEQAEAARVFARYFSEMPAPPPRVERPAVAGAGFDPNRSLRRMLSEPGEHCRALE